MTRKEFRKRMNGIIRENTKEAKKRVEKAMKAGCLDIEGEETHSYLLCKCLMTAICRDLADGWKPFTKEGQKTVKNIELFL